MTLIAALRKKGRVYMAGDRMASGRMGDAFHLQAPKIWKVGRFLVGAAGGGRFAQVAQYSIPWAELSEELPDYGLGHNWVINRLIPKLREVFRETGQVFTTKGDVEEERLLGQLLVAVGKDFYTIDDDLDVVNSSEPYAAIGSGEPYARAALYATSYQGGALSPYDRLAIACYAASQFSQTVGPPFDFYNSLEDEPVQPNVVKPTYFHGISNPPTTDD